MIIIIIGPGGSGKSTLVKSISEILNIKKIISTTSRKIRKNEIDHVDYHFISKDDFKKRIEQNLFLEFDEIYDNYYGIAHNDFNENCIATLTIDGAKFVMQNHDNVIILYLKCSYKICRERMMLRDNINKRCDDLYIRLKKDQVLYRKIPYSCFLVDASMPKENVLTEALRFIKQAYKL